MRYLEEDAREYLQLSYVCLYIHCITLLEVERDSPEKLDCNWTCYCLLKLSTEYPIYKHNKMMETHVINFTTYLIKISAISLAV